MLLCPVERITNIAVMTLASEHRYMIPRMQIPANNLKALP
jgi:hypothetical protein